MIEHFVHMCVLCVCVLVCLSMLLRVLTPSACMGFLSISPFKNKCFNYNYNNNNNNNNNNNKNNKNNKNNENNNNNLLTIYYQLYTRIFMYVCL